MTCEVFRPGKVRGRCPARIWGMILGTWGLLLGIAPSGIAQSSRMAYQGRLTESGAPATGTFSMQFGLFDTPEVGTGARQGTEIEIAEILVVEGVFTALLDFGVAVFDGPARFLEIRVRRSDGAGAWNTLSPRQALTAVPYAIRTLGAAPASDALFADGRGNVAIGTNQVPSGVRLNVAGATRIAPGGAGGAVQIGSPNGETGMTISGTNRMDLRFGRDTVTLAAGANAGPPPPWNGITLNTNGNVGIGLAELAANSLWKLEVRGPTRIAPVGTAGGAIQFSTPSGETGMSILGRNRADLRFDDTTVKLVAGAGNGAPGNTRGLAVDLEGRVGIGTTAPSHALTVAGQASISDRLQVGPVTLPSARVHVAAESQTAILAETSDLDIPAILASGRTHGRAVHADGHVTQERGAGGIAKAMAVIQSGQVLTRCFNGVGSGLEEPELNRGKCGMIVTSTGDDYTHTTYIDFGFEITDRFVLATPTLRSDRLMVANVYFAPLGNTHEIAVVVGAADGDTLDEDDGTPFTVVVF